MRELYGIACCSSREKYNLTGIKAHFKLRYRNKKRFKERINILPNKENNMRTFLGKVDEDYLKMVEKRKQEENKEKEKKESNVKNRKN